MGVMKTIHTEYHLKGSRAFDHYNPYERMIANKMLARRHEEQVVSQTIGRTIHIPASQVESPELPGIYSVIDTMTDTQQFVQYNTDRTVLPIGQTHWLSLESFNNPWFRWAFIHPLNKESITELI